MKYEECGWKLALCTHGVVKEVLVTEADAVFKLGFVTPTELGSFADIEELTRGAIGTGGVPFDFAFVANDLGNEFGESLDGEFLASAGINSLIA